MGPHGMENNPSLLIFNGVFINRSELEEISDFWIIVIVELKDQWLMGLVIF